MLKRGRGTAFATQPLWPLADLRYPLAASEVRRKPLRATESTVLTSPSAKPDTSATDTAATENTADVTQGTQQAAEVTRLTTGGSRRAAPLILRMGSKKPSAVAVREAGEEPQPQRARAAVRGSAKGASRAGFRAQARAARMALSEADTTTGNSVVDESAGEAVAPADVVFSSVRRRYAPASLPAAPALTVPAQTAPAQTIPAQTAPQAEPAPVPYRPDTATQLPAIAPAAAPSPVVFNEDEDDQPTGPGGRRRGMRAERRADRAFKSNDPVNYVVAPTVGIAQMRPRHYGVIALFLLCVIVPTISYSWYLWTRAADQYESDVGFGSRTEEAPSTFDFLGALGGTAQSGSKDMDILNQFVVTQELVAKIDAELDLKAMYSKPSDDPLNAFNEAGTIEDLVAYWQRMVLIDYDNGTGLMNLRVFAFDPTDARKIATAVLDESTAIINQLSKTAQEDTTRYSKEALAATEGKLAEARLAVLDFQVRNSIVDPSNVVASQLSVVATLNQQLAGAQIDFDMLSGTVPEGDPRLAQLNRRLEVIGNRIVEEQAKVGATADSDSPGFAKLMADFERLKVEQDFAQAAYLSALAAHDQALTDAQQKTRYLATYVAPTLAEAPTAPNRPLTAALTALIGFLIWSILVLTYYALRDRR